jgi:hypothetical protein
VRVSAIPRALRTPFRREKREVIGLYYSLSSDDKSIKKTVKREEKKADLRSAVLKKV